MLATRSFKNLLVTAALGALGLGCSTPKLAASEAFVPEVQINTIPQGADVKRDGQVIGRAPLSIPVRRSDAAAHLNIELDYPNYIPAELKLDADAIYRSGGGETWVALKSLNLGTETPDIDATKASDLDRAGAKVAKAGRYEEALQFFARALVVDSQYPRAHRDMGWCLAKLKRRDEAIAQLNQYLLLSPDADDAASVEALLAKARGSRDIDLSTPHPEEDH